MPDLTPNYLTTDPSGGVGAVFSGLLSASGIQLPYQPYEQSGGPGAGFSNEIQWLYPPDTGLADLVLARITATRGGSGAMSTWTYAPEFIAGSKLLTQIRMRHFLLGAPAADRNLSQIEAIVQGAIDGVGTLSPIRSAKILDHNGNSDFVQKKNVISAIIGPGSLGAYYSPWNGYPAPYALRYDWWESGLFVLRGMVTTGASGAYNSQYVCTLPAPAPRLGGGQRILTENVGVGVSAGSGIYCNMRFDIVPLSATATVLVFGGFSTGPADGSPVSWCPVNIAYYTDLPWGQAFYS